MSRAKNIDLEVVHTRTFQRSEPDPFEVHLMAAPVSGRSETITALV